MYRGMTNTRGITRAGDARRCGGLKEGKEEEGEEEEEEEEEEDDDDDDRTKDLFILLPLS